VTVDGLTDACSKNEDIVFRFDGFGIRGSVVTRSSETGPAGVSVSLYPVGSEASPLQTALTDASGNFRFSGVVPGKYTVRVDASSRQQYSFASSEQDIAIVNDAAVCKPFLIIGYDIVGEVLSTEGTPILNVGVQLEGAGKESAAFILTGSDGAFKFGNVSGGEYVIRPVGNQSLELSPSQVTVTVTDRNVHAGTFRLKSFRLSGKVLSGQSGTSLPKAKVTARQSGAVLEAFTDETGVYVLEKVSVGDMTLSASAPDMAFETMTLKVKTPYDQLADIVASKFMVSGQVLALRPSDGQLSIAFQPSTGDAVTTGIDSEGRFSALLTPGSYKCQAFSAKNQKRFSLLPEDLKVANGPQKNVNFNTKKFSLSGEVHCTSKDHCSDIVSLLSDDTVIATKPVASGKFEFADLLPGRYSVSVSNAEKCWLQAQQDVDLQKNTNNLQFKQSGYRIMITSPVDTTAALHEVGKAAAPIPVQLKKGENIVCVQEPKELSVRAEGCFRFRSQPDTFNPTHEKKVSLTVESVEVKVRVRSKSDVAKSSHFLISSAGGDDRVTLSSGKDGVFELSHFASVNEQLTVRPSSEDHFFEPESAVLRASQHCASNVVEFVAVQGQFISGQISPAVDGVAVRLEQLDITTASNEKGAFKLGPLRGDAGGQKIVLAKDGYFFEETQTYAHFKSHRLASITVTVVDGEKHPLADAVVSISGGSSFRSNSQSKDDGKVVVVGLHPGEYFVKGFLKEWTFEPRSHVLTLASGEQKELVLTGKRVAFSVFGRVTSVVGLPMAGVVLLAHGRGHNCEGHNEEAVTDSAGSFRLSALKPKCEYNVTAGGSVERFIPNQRQTVRVEHDDVHLAQRIVAVRKRESFDVAVLVKMSQANHPATVRAKISHSNGFVRSEELVVNRMTVLRPLPSATSPYSLEVDVAKETLSLAVDDSFVYVVIDDDHRDGARRHKSTTPKWRHYLAFFVACFILAAMIFAYRHVFLKRKKIN
jgi:hypothetical protein